MSRLPTYVENLMVNDDYWRDKGEEFQIDRGSDEDEDRRPSRRRLIRERKAYEEAEYGLDEE